MFKIILRICLVNAASARAESVEGIFLSYLMRKKVFALKIIFYQMAAG